MQITGLSLARWKRTKSAFVGSLAVLIHRTGSQPSLAHPLERANPPARVCCQCPRSSRSLAALPLRSPLALELSLSPSSSPSAVEASPSRWRFRSSGRTPLLGFAVNALAQRRHSPLSLSDLHSPSSSPSSSPSAVEASPSRFRQKVRRFEYHLLPSPSVVELVFEI
jgi:hypothetical protein